MEEPAPRTPDEEAEEEAPICGPRQVFDPQERRLAGGAIEQLGLELLQKLPISPQQPNIILSPLSLALALAQLTLGQSVFSLYLCLLCFYVPSNLLAHSFSLRRS